MKKKNMNNKKKYIYMPVFNEREYWAAYGPRKHSNSVTYYIKQQEFEEEFEKFYIYKDMVFYKNEWTQNLEEAKKQLTKTYNEYYENIFFITLRKG